MLGGRGKWVAPTLILEKEYVGLGNTKVGTSIASAYEINLGAITSAFCWLSLNLNVYLLLSQHFLFGFPGLQIHLTMLLAAILRLLHLLHDTVTPRVGIRYSIKNNMERRFFTLKF